MNKSLLITSLILAVGVAHGQVIPLRKYAGNLKVVDVIIRDQTYPFLFDTGGGDMFITPELCKQVNKEPFGNVVGFRMNGERLDFPRIDSITFTIGGEKMACAGVGVWNLMKLLPSDFPEIYGVISLKSFGGRTIGVDLKVSQITIVKEGVLRKAVKNMVEVPSIFSTGVSGQELNVFLKVNNRDWDYWLLFDSGNIDKVLLSSATARDWGLLDDTTTVKNRELGMVTVTVGQAADQLNAAASEMIYDGALGFDFIARHFFIIDLQNRRVWME